MLDFSLLLHLPFGLEFQTISHIPHLLAQATPSGLSATSDDVQRCLNAVFTPNDTALSCGNLMSKRAADAWSETWQQKIGGASPEFLTMLNISRYIAGPAIALWAIAAIRDFTRNRMGETWPQTFAVAMAIAVFYLNQGAIVRSTIMASRALMNWNNEQILLVSNASIRYEDKLSELADFTLVENEIVQYRQQCNGLTNNREMFDCLTRAEQMVKDDLDDYMARHGETGFTLQLQSYAKSLIGDPKEFVGGVLGEAGAVAVGGVVGGPVGAATVGGVILLGKVANSATGLAAEGILAYTSSLAQNIVEASWLFTAITVPIPLAFAFYPGTRNVFIGWLIGFFSLGLFKINLNIASSLIVSMIYGRGPGEPVLDLALMSLGVVILALGMTAGGGLAIFSGITAALTSLTFGLVNIAVPTSSK